MNATPLELAYAAGLFDGEGSVMIVFRPESKWSRPTYCLQTQLVSCDRCLVDWMQDRFGGSISTFQPSTATGRARVAHNWITGSRLAAQFLEAILPFVILKRERILIALQFRKTITTGGRPITPELLEIRKTLHAEMRLLNQRGRPIKEKKYAPR